MNTGKLLFCEMLKFRDPEVNVGIVKVKWIVRSHYLVSIFDSDAGSKVYFLHLHFNEREQCALHIGFFGMCVCFIVFFHNRVVF